MSGIHRSLRSVVLRVFCVAVAILLLGELSVRVLNNRLPEPITWYHPLAQVKVEQMDAIRSSGTTVSVVLAGTSQMAIGADPIFFRSLLDTHPYTYNAALLAGYPSANHRFLPEEVLPRLHPKLVVYGVSSEDIEAGPEAPYDKALATEPGALGEADRWASSHSALMMHRQDLRDPTVLAYALTIGQGGGQLDHYRSSVVGEAGRWMFQTNPKCVSERNPQVSEPPGGGFTPDAARMAVVWATIDALRAQNVAVAVAVMPFADCAFTTPGEVAHDAAGRAIIAAEARDRGLELVDVSAQVHSDDLFTDPGHLNSTGTRRFTELLASALRNL